MPRMRKRRRGSRGDEDIQVGKPTAAWMLTYSDLVTQILIFFVLFLTLMTLREKRIAGMILPLIGAKGTVVKESGERVISPIINQPQLLTVKQQILIYSMKKGIADEIKTRMDERGLTISFAEKAMFKVGRADILPEARFHLDEISKILRVIPNNIRVEGHTCNIPIHNEQFASNWDLSSGRATNVIKYLIEETDFPPAKLSAAGYGEYHPYAPNDTEENRRMNRRVDVVVLWRRAQTLP